MAENEKEKMSVRPFVIDQEIKTAIFKMRDYADANPFSTDEILDMVNGDIPLAGDIPEHRIFMPFGFKLVYSTNWQGDKKVRMMSMSIDKVGAMVNPHIIEMVMVLLGFENNLKGCSVDVEAVGDKKAVVVAELVSDS